MATHLSFGTDGVRARANSELTPEFAVALGRSAVEVLGVDRLVVGRDTRRSGPLLESAISAGAASAGADVVLLGVVPTPAVAVIAEADGSGGAMISASHNPFADNGIKFFGPGGRKLTDSQQSEISERLGGDVSDAPTGAAVGTISSNPHLVSIYLDRCAAAVGAGALAGLAVVLDCAHGSQSEIARDLVVRAGANVTVIGAEPDGTNINDGVGSTAPEALAAEVVARGADLGLAFDGDADRVVAVDARGEVVDGDRIIGLLALDLADQGRLADDTVVVTVMTNQGFRLAMAERGITVIDTPVGDRHVLEALHAGGFSIGGEQSGHVIVPEWGPTGDGLLTGLLLCDAVARSGRPLADLAAEIMERMPQVLVNVEVDRGAAEVVDRLGEAIAEVEAGLGDGRVLVRPSGTEPLVRVMVEAADEATAIASANRLAQEIAALTG